MSDDERSSFDKLPRVLVFDGDAESYLDADEAYQRWARRHYKGGLDKWIYGGKCPIKPGMDQAEIARICHLVIASTTRTHPKYAEVLWDSPGLLRQGSACRGQTTAAGSTAAIASFLKDLVSNLGPHARLPANKATAAARRAHPRPFKKVRRRVPATERAAAHRAFRHSEQLREQSTQDRP